MASHDWKTVVRELRAKTAPPTAEQRALAAHSGVKLPRGVPALVAAAALREGLSNALDLQEPAAPTAAQLEYLRDICGSDAAAKRLPSCDTFARASAWIQITLARRAADALERLQPSPGDVVSDTLWPGSLGQVVSIGANGDPYLRGGRGQRIPAFRATVVASATDTSRKANRARRDAANQRELAAPALSEPTPSKLRQLERYRVRSAPTPEQVALLRKAIDEAPDEAPVQRVLERYPELLGATVTSSYGTFVLPQVSLGGKKRPDFAVVVADSAGFHWTLIELESPRVPMANKNGTLAAKARTGVQQIEDWREWLTPNIAFARASAAEGGVGLPDVRPEAPGIVFVSRRGLGPPLPPGRRQRIHETQHIEIHSYDWLLDAVEHRAHPKGPHPGGLFLQEAWPDWFSADNDLDSPW